MCEFSNLYCKYFGFNADMRKCEMFKEIDSFFIRLIKGVGLYDFCDGFYVGFFYMIYKAGVRLYCKKY